MRIENWNNEVEASIITMYAQQITFIIIFLKEAHWNYSVYVLYVCICIYVLLV